MKKKSYFNSTEIEVDEPYDLDKWNYLAKIIKYDSQRLGPIKSLDYHSYVNISDPEENRKFKLWYKEKTASGENMKKIRKTAIEQFGLNPNPNYTQFGSSYSEPTPQAEAAKRKMEYEKMYGKIPEEESPEQKSKQRRVDLGKRLIKYIVLIQKNLLSSDDIDIETFQEALTSLNDLANTVKRIKTAEMKIDLMYRTSNKLNKLGLVKQASDMKKFAQQQEQDLQTDSLQPEAIEQQTPVDPATQPPVQEVEAPIQDESSKLETALDGSQEAEPVKLSEIDTKGPEEGEYDKIIDENVNIHDAAGKLEDVASMLADRRVIRYLAEFDIMLDKLGIASMFPELAESQSKLIDSYSYALTRVSKMMGQLSNAADILRGMESGSVPGSKGTDAE
jgi:hypothetical protein